MKVIVLGGGVVGITTAYYLARGGAQVTVIEHHDGPALETSFANAGQVSPGYSTPWAAPGIPVKALKWMLQRHAPLAIRADGSLFQLRWMAQMLRNCTSARYAVTQKPPALSGSSWCSPATPCKAMCLAATSAPASKVASPFGLAAK